MFENYMGPQRLGDQIPGGYNFDTARLSDMAEGAKQRLFGLQPLSLGSGYVQSRAPDPSAFVDYHDLLNKLQQRRGGY